MPWNLFILYFVLLSYCDIWNPFYFTVTWWYMSHHTISFTLEVFCFSQRKGVAIFLHVCIVLLKPFWKATKCFGWYELNEKFCFFQILSAFHVNSVKENKSKLHNQCSSHSVTIRNKYIGILILHFRNLHLHCLFLSWRNVACTQHVSLLHSHNQPSCGLCSEGGCILGYICRTLCYTSNKPSLLWYQDKILSLPCCQYLLLVYQLL